MSIRIKKEAQVSFTIDEIELLAGWSRDHWNAECRNFHLELWRLWCGVRFGKTDAWINLEEAEIIVRILELAPGSELLGKWISIRERLK